MTLAPEAAKRAKARYLGRRRGTLRVAVDDPRSPMRRLLEQTVAHGHAFPTYDQQWRTIWRAARLGLIEDNGAMGYMGTITEVGRTWLADPKNA